MEGCYFWLVIIGQEIKIYHLYLAFILAASYRVSVNDSKYIFHLFFFIVSSCSKRIYSPVSGLS